MNFIKLLAYPRVWGILNAGKILCVLNIPSWVLSFYMTVPFVLFKGTIIMIWLLYLRIVKCPFLADIKMARHKFWVSESGFGLAGNFLGKYLSFGNHDEKWEAVFFLVKLTIKRATSSSHTSQIKSLVSYNGTSQSHCEFILMHILLTNRLI